MAPNEQHKLEFELMRWLQTKRIENESSSNSCQSEHLARELVRVWIKPMLAGARLGQGSTMNPFPDFVGAKATPKRKGKPASRREPAAETSSTPAPGNGILDCVTK